jgi:pimeloyl-ACP methyl ester carboxylesterase
VAGTDWHAEPDPEVVDSWFGPLRTYPGARRDAVKLLRSARKEQTLAAAERFGDFRRPVLVAWAPEDRYFLLADGERLARDLPDSQFELIRDSYAFVAEDQPDRTAELIATFMRERVAP